MLLHNIYINTFIYIHLFSETLYTCIYIYRFKQVSVQAQNTLSFTEMHMQMGRNAMQYLPWLDLDTPQTARFTLSVKETLPKKELASNWPTQGLSSYKTKSISL